MVFVAGQRLTAAALDGSVVSNGDRQTTGFGTTTSTTYTSTLSGGTIAATTFVAPPSGTVVIINNNYMFNSGANTTLCSFEVRTGPSIGSGDIIVGDNDHNANILTLAAGLSFGRSYRLPGLVPGNIYNVRQRVRVSAGTGTFHRHEIDVLAG